MLSKPIELSYKYIERLMSKLKESELIKELCESKLTKINTGLRLAKKSYLIQKLEHLSFSNQGIFIKPKPINLF
jgi:hypothetical protein